MHVTHEATDKLVSSGTLKNAVESFLWLLINYVMRQQGLFNFHLVPLLAYVTAQIFGVLKMACRNIKISPFFHASTFGK